MFVLLSSFSALAENGWICNVKKESDAVQLKGLKLGKKLYLADIQILTVDKKYCDLPHIFIYAGVCQFKGHTLSIGLDSASELVTKKGKKISLSCEADERAGTAGVGGGSN